MSRLSFLQSLSVFAGAVMLPAVSRAASSCKILQVSPATGFQYHHGEMLWPQLPPRTIPRPGTRSGKSI